MNGNKLQATRRNSGLDGVSGQEQSKNAGNISPASDDCQAECAIGNELKSGEQQLQASVGECDDNFLYEDRRELREQRSGFSGAKSAYAGTGDIKESLTRGRDIRDGRNSVLPKRNMHFNRIGFKRSRSNVFHTIRGGLSDNGRTIIRRLVQALTLVCLFCSTTFAGTGTPFFFNFLNTDGTANTNAALMQTWPPTQVFYIYGTNLVYGVPTILLTNLNGYGTNIALSGAYRVLFTNTTPGQAFYVNLPDIGTPVNLVLYATNVPVNNPGGANAWGGFRGVVSDTSLEFLTSAVSNAGPGLNIITNTTGGVTRITLTNSYVAAGSIGLYTNSITGGTSLVISNSTTLATSNLTGSLTYGNYTTNTYGTLKGQQSDTNIGFLTNILNTAGSLTTYTNVTNGLTTLTLSNAPVYYAQFLTNALVTNCPTINLWTNNTGGWVAGRVFVLPTVTTFKTNTFTFNLFSTNETGLFTNLSSLVSTNVGPMFMTNNFDVLISNTTVLTFNTICTTNATYNLRVAFQPWIFK